MGRTAILAGTSYDGREKIIRNHCRDGAPVQLRRDPGNEFDENAIAVLLRVPRLGGIFGHDYKQIGFIKAGTAKSLAKRLDAGEDIRAHVKSFYAPPERFAPRVTIELDY